MVKSTMSETCSAVLRSRRNCSSDGAERTDDGRAFHARAAVTGRASWCTVIGRGVSSEERRESAVERSRNKLTSKREIVRELWTVQVVKRRSERT